VKKDSGAARSAAERYVARYPGGSYTVMAVKIPDSLMPSNRFALRGRSPVSVRS
jgi:hypothetical protein